MQMLESIKDYESKGYQFKHNNSFSFIYDTFNALIYNKGFGLSSYKAYSDFLNILNPFNWPFKGMVGIARSLK
jgi:hypothetical protein